MECKFRGIEDDVGYWGFYVYIDVYMALESEVLEVGGEGKGGISREGRSWVVVGRGRSPCLLLMGVGRNGVVRVTLCVEGADIVFSHYRRK